MGRANISECPNCQSGMKQVKAPFNYHGMYIGLFEAYVCDFCKRTYFTETAYKEILATPTSVEDFQPFVEQDTNLVEEMKLILPFQEVLSISDSRKNKTSTTEEDLITS